MADESYSFSTARARLEDIVAQVRKKDTTLEKSLDLLEEGVRLANACTEQIDQQDWAAANAANAQEGEADAGAAEATAAEQGSDSASADVIVVDGVAVIEDVVVTDDDGEFVAEILQVTEYVPAADADEAEDAWVDEDEQDVAERPDEPSADEG